jgi:putative peptidoglycan lipid II flippase
VGQEVGPADEEGLNERLDVEVAAVEGAIQDPDSSVSVMRSAAVMSVGTGLSRLTGLIRVSVTLAALGLTPLSNTYNLANTTPNIVYELILGGILTSVFVPVFVGWARTHGREESFAVAQRTMTLALVVLGTLAVVVGIFAPAIMRLYLVASDFADKQAQVELGAFFLRWFVPQIVFYGIGAVATGVLNANRRFAVPMFAPILNNVAVILTMGAFILMADGRVPSLDSITAAERTLLAAGTTLGVVAMTAALWPSLRRLGYRWRLRFDWRHEAIRRLARLATWVVVYVVANQLAYLVIIVLNNRVAPEDGITAYSQAFVFFQLPYAIFAVSIFTAILPGMAERWTDGSPEGVRTLFSRGVRDMVVIVVPAAIGYVVLARPIVAMLAEYGAVTPAGADLLARTLQAFSIGLPFFAAFQLLTRTFYATQDSRTPALLNVAAAGVNVGVDLALVAAGFGVPGLALGHAVSYAFGAGALTLLLSGRLGGLDGRRIARTVAQVLPVAILSAGAAWAVSQVFESNLSTERALLRVLQVLAAVGAGLLVFLSGARIVRIDEVTDVMRALRRRFSR